MGSISNLVKELENENLYLKKSNEIMANVVGKSLYKYEYRGKDYKDDGYVIARNTDDAVKETGYSEDLVICTIMSKDEFMTLINHNVIHRIF